MNPNIDKQLASRIRQLADKYETADFLAADPSSFMHRVTGAANQEAMAFIASCLSYGSRKQFFPKIQFVLDASGGEVDRWVRSDEWQNDIADTAECFYRLYTRHDMCCLLAAYSRMLNRYGSYLPILCRARSQQDCAQEHHFGMQTSVHVYALDGAVRFSRRPWIVGRHHQPPLAHHAARHTRCAGKSANGAAQQSHSLNVNSPTTYRRNARNIPR